MHPFPPATRATALAAPRHAFPTTNRYKARAQTYIYAAGFGQVARARVPQRRSDFRHFAIFFIAALPPLSQPGLAWCDEPERPHRSFAIMPPMPVTKPVLCQRIPTPPWGNPRRAPSEEARVAEFLRALPEGPARARSLCAKVLVAMPGLWKELVSADPSLEKRGTPGATIMVSGGPNAEQGLRIFDDGAELEALLASPAFASFARRLSAGRIRAADAAERELTYRLQMVAFTPDTPITIVELGNQRVAFLLAEGRVYWIELLSGWTRAGDNPSLPLAPVRNK